MIRRDDVAKLSRLLAHQLVRCASVGNRLALCVNEFAMFFQVSFEFFKMANGLIIACYQTSTPPFWASGNKGTPNPFQFSHSATGGLPKQSDNPSLIYVKKLIPSKDRAVSTAPTNAQSLGPRCARTHIDDPKINLKVEQ